MYLQVTLSSRPGQQLSKDLPRKIVPCFVGNTPAAAAATHRSQLVVLAGRRVLSPPSNRTRLAACVTTAARQAVSRRTSWVLKWKKKSNVHELFGLTIYLCIRCFMIGEKNVHISLRIGLSCEDQCSRFAHRNVIFIPAFLKANTAHAWLPSKLLLVTVVITVNITETWSTLNLSTFSIKTNIDRILIAHH